MESIENEWDVKIYPKINKFDKKVTFLLKISW